LAAQFGFYLTKIVEQIIGPPREISSPPGLLSETSQNIFPYTFKSESVADANRVNDHACPPRAIYRFIEFPAACVIDTVGEKDDCSSCNLIIGRPATDLVVGQH